MRRLWFSIFLFCALQTVSVAAVKYPILPFKTTVTSSDILHIHYDLSEKKAISCTSSLKQAHAHFYYKGFQKSAQLPITLQTSHLPRHAHEHLTDLKGDIAIAFEDNALNPQGYRVSCQYID